MGDFRLLARSAIDAPADLVHAWHFRDAAARRLCPAWGPVRPLDPSPAGTQRAMRLRLGPLRGRWLLERSVSEKNRTIREVQVTGPFSRWQQTTTVVPREDGGSLVEDEVEGALSAPWIAFARSRLLRLFTARHAVAAGDLARHAGLPGGRAGTYAVSGASGLIGSAVADFLEAGGHRVLRLVRNRSGSGDRLAWNPMTGEIDAARLEGVDGVIHLAGAGVAAGRWTPARKEIIRASRVAGTSLIAETLARLERPPRVLVSASAIGYYGDRGEEIAGRARVSRARGFLAET